MRRQRRYGNCDVYVTFDKEYVMAARVCVGIRDRPSGRWEAVAPNRLLGAVPREERDDEFVADCVAPRVGERLCLQIAGQRVVSSPILAIERDAGPMSGQGAGPTPRTLASA